MAARRKALDELISKMQDIRDTSIRYRQYYTYLDLQTKDAERAKNPRAKIPARFTAGLEEYVDKGIIQKRPRDPAECAMFKNAADRGVQYEKRTYNQLTQGFKKGSDYSLLKSIIEGPHAGHYQSGLGNVSARLDLLGNYFGYDMDGMERSLTTDQARDLKAMLEKKCKSSYWKQTNEQKGYIDRAKRIIERIDKYICPPQTAIIISSSEAIDSLENIMGRERAAKTMSILENLTPSNGEYAVDDMKRAGIISYLRTSFSEAGIDSLGTPTYGKSAIAIKRSRIAALRRGMKDNLEKYSFMFDNHNISLVNDALLQMTG